MPKGLSKAEIARRLKRHQSTIGNEINRWGATQDYNCGLADRNGMDERTRPKGRKLSRCYPLRRFVLEHLRLRWSPEQIASALQALYPENPRMNTPHESIYTRSRGFAIRAPLSVVKRLK